MGVIRASLKMFGRIRDGHWSCLVLFESISDHARASFGKVQKNVCALFWATFEHAWTSLGNVTGHA